MPEDILNRRLSGKDDGKDMEFAYPSCDELRILRSKIQNDNGIMVSVHKREREIISMGPGVPKGRIRS